MTQTYRYVLLCAIRARGITSGQAETDRVSIDIGCPYCVDGKLFGATFESTTTLIENRLDDTVKAIAHRGYSSAAPENTLPAYVLAKKKGYSYAETDINFTIDEVPVLLHDDTIDRTSDGEGNITQLTFEQVRQYDFGSWFNSSFAGTKIPSLEEFLQLCHRLAIHPYLEIKQAMTITPERSQKLAQIVKSCGLKGRVTYISFNYDALVAIKAYDPYARLGYLGGLTNEFSDQTNALKSGQNEVFADVWYPGVTKALTDYALSLDVPVEVWTMNASGDVLPYVNLGVSGITTDTLNVRKILNESEGI